MSTSQSVALFFPIHTLHSPVNLSVRRSLLPYPYSSPPCQPLSPSLFSSLSLLFTPLSTSQSVDLCSPILTPHSLVNLSVRRSFLPCPYSSLPCQPLSPSLFSSLSLNLTPLSTSQFVALFFPIPNPHSPVNLSVRRSFLPYPYSSLPCQPLSTSIFAPLSLLLTPLSTSQSVALFFPIPTPHSPVNISVRRSLLPYPYSSLPCQPLSPSLFSSLSVLFTPLSTSQSVDLCSPILTPHSLVNLSVRRSFLPYP